VRDAFIWDGHDGPVLVVQTYASASRPRRPGARPGLPCHVPACGGRAPPAGLPIAGRSGGGGRRRWCEEWARAARTILLLHIKVLGINGARLLLLFAPIFVSARTNQRHHHLGEGGGRREEGVGTTEEGVKEPLFTELDWYVVGRKTREDCKLLLFMNPLLIVGMLPHRICLSRAGTAVSAPAAAAPRAAGRLREKPPGCPRGARFGPCAHRCWVPPPLASAKTGWASRSRTPLPPRKAPSRFVCGQPP
jgi:hypothetical protein